MEIRSTTSGRRARSRESSRTASRSRARRRRSRRSRSRHNDTVAVSRSSALNRRFDMQDRYPGALGLSRRVLGWLRILNVVYGTGIVLLLLASVVVPEFLFAA